MTEDEAKKQSCPHHMVSATISSVLVKMLGAPTDEQLVAMAELGRCNASGCMMWQSDTGTCGLAKIKEA